LGEFYVKPLVEVRNLSKTIGKKTILNNLNFNIYPGEILGFLGPNGSGKTTTIKIMLGMMKATNGSVVIDGYDIKKKYEKAIRNVGGVLENPEFYGYMSGYDNIKTNSRLYKGIDKDKIDGIIEKLELEDYINSKVKTYSLGMRQNLGIAQALIHSPKILILDEPSNGLDPRGIKNLRNLMRDLARIKNIAIFISSHILYEMELMCDRVIIINSGKFISEQKIKDRKIDVEIESSKVIFTVNNFEKAYKIFVDLNLDVEIIDRTIEVKTVRERIPFLVKKLVKQNIDVFEVKMHKKTLEDMFLESIKMEA
jgi:ABC-2 type transport system ATP-binding protein